MRNREPLTIPESLRWLDDAARAVYEAAHRFSEGNGHTPNVPWGYCFPSEGKQGAPRSWQQVLAVYPAWCFHAAMALPLCKPPPSRAREVATWARGESLRRGEEQAERGDRFGVHALVALAEEAERIERGA